ncbi:hypothetical protein SAMN04487886_11798, partial [Clostridium sp. DSM 8431]|uniref:hypothetical protein n=1 Tax=Clostridium sp. DSM 8431 TaxID=1761781 RepID=UPI0008EEE179
IAVYRGVSTKYLANYLALFKFIFSKFDENPINIKGEHSYLSTNFKGRPPMFEWLVLFITLFKNTAFTY